MSLFFFLFIQLYELGDEVDRKAFLDDLFTFMQKRGKFVVCLVYMKSLGHDCRTAGEFLGDLAIVSQHSQTTSKLNFGSQITLIPLQSRKRFHVCILTPSWY